MPFLLLLPHGHHEDEDAILFMVVSSALSVCLRTGDAQSTDLNPWMLQEASIHCRYLKGGAVTEEVSSTTCLRQVRCPFQGRGGQGGISDCVPSSQTEPSLVFGERM